MAGWPAVHPEGMVHGVEEEFQQTRDVMVSVGRAAKQMRAMGAEWGAVRIEILQMLGCPLVGRVLETVQKVLARSEIRAEIEDLVGDYPSPPCSSTVVT